MQRDERMLESGLDNIIQRVTELRDSINTLIFRLENEYTTLNWTTVLDNFQVLSSKINNLNKLLRSEKLPLMKNFAVFPLQLNPNRDPELERVTLGRVSVFNHELVPQYLRTKPDPVIEEKIAAMADKSINISQDTLLKKMQSMNKLATNVAEQVRTYKESIESEGSVRNTQPQLCLPSDTTALVAAITLGKGIKPSQRPVTPANAAAAAAVAAGSSLQAQQSTAAADHLRAAAASNQGGASSMGKAPSAIKTNIKSAASMNPYGR